MLWNSGTSMPQAGTSSISDLSWLAPFVSTPPPSSTPIPSTSFLFFFPSRAVSPSRPLGALLSKPSSYSSTPSCSPSTSSTQSTPVTPVVVPPGHSSPSSAMKAIWAKLSASNSSIIGILSSLALPSLLPSFSSIATPSPVPPSPVFNFQFSIFIFHSSILFPGGNTSFSPPSSSSSTSPWRLSACVAVPPRPSAPSPSATPTNTSTSLLKLP